MVQDCPNCGKGFLKKVTRKNWPFGRKSKPVYTQWVSCNSNCGYNKLISKNEK